MEFRLFVKKDMRNQSCPSCKNRNSLKRKRSTNIFEKILKFFNYGTYFCKECSWRGRIFSYKPSKKFYINLLAYIVLIILTYFLSQYFAINY